MKIIVAAAADRPAAHRRRRRRADTTTGRSDTKYQAPTGRSSGGSRSIPRGVHGTCWRVDSPTTLARGLGTREEPTAREPHRPRPRLTS
jgi:hypothetical protein